MRAFFKLKKLALGKQEKKVTLKNRNHTRESSSSTATTMYTVYKAHTQLCFVYENKFSVPPHSLTFARPPHELRTDDNDATAALAG